MSDADAVNPLLAFPLCNACWFGACHEETPIPCQGTAVKGGRCMCSCTLQTWPATVDYDADDRPCLQCGATVHLHNHPACPHGQVACAGCGHAMVCGECARAAELEALDAAGGEPPC